MLAYFSNTLGLVAYQGCRNVFIHGGAKIIVLFEMWRAPCTVKNYSSFARNTQKTIFIFYQIYFPITIVISLT